uniref:(northern house mosquito) hypothetical protein n=1 Tax=Culex pipiens TaxID=7175 RepID=A0A8D8DP95_CULPI
MCYSGLTIVAAWFNDTKEECEFQTDEASKTGYVSATLFKLTHAKLNTTNKMQVITILTDHQQRVNLFVVDCVYGSILCNSFYRRTKANLVSEKKNTHLTTNSKF